MVAVWVSLQNEISIQLNISYAAYILKMTIIYVTYIYFTILYLYKFMFMSIMWIFSANKLELNQIEIEFMNVRLNVPLTGKSLSKSISVFICWCFQLVDDPIFIHIKQLEQSEGKPEGFNEVVNDMTRGISGVKHIADASRAVPKVSGIIRQ